VLAGEPLILGQAASNPGDTEESFSRIKRFSEKLLKLFDIFATRLTDKIDLSIFFDIMV
jgi:hypothetical protein